MSLEGARGTVSIIDKATAPLRNIAKSFLNMGTSAKDSTKDVNKTTLALGKLSAMQNRIGRIQANNKRQTSGISSQAVGVAAFGLALRSVLNPAIKFEQSMKNLQAVAFGTADSTVDVAGNMAKLSEQAQKLGATTAYSATQAAEGQLFLAKAGFKTNDILASMSPLLSLAAASQTELGRASDITSDLLGAFGMTAKDTGKLADVLAAATSSANVDMETLFETLKVAAPIGIAAGQSMEAITTATALLGNVGIKGSMAGTALKNALTNLASPASEGAKVLQDLGIKTSDAQGNMLPLQDIMLKLGKTAKGLSQVQRIKAFDAVFGKIAMAGAINLEKAVNSGDFEKMLKNLENSEGVAKKMANIQMDSTAGSIKALTSAAEGVAITFGNLLTPALRGFAEITTSLGTPLQKIIKENEGVVKIIGLVAGAILTAKVASLAYVASLWLVSPALTALSVTLGVVKGAMLLLNMAFMASPMGFLIALGTTALIIASNWDSVTATFKELWETIKLFDFSKMGESMNRITESIGLGSFFGDDEKDKDSSTTTNEVIKNIQGQNNISNQAVIQVNVANGQTNVQSKGDFDTQVEVNNGVQE